MNKKNMFLKRIPDKFNSGYILSRMDQNQISHVEIYMFLKSRLLSCNDQRPFNRAIADFAEAVLEHAPYAYWVGDMNEDFHVPDLLAFALTRTAKVVETRKFSKRAVKFACRIWELMAVHEPYVIQHICESLVYSLKLRRSDVEHDPKWKALNEEQREFVVYREN